MMSMRTAGILNGFSSEDKEYVQDSYALVAKAHKRQFRYGKLPYITHPEGSLFILDNEILQPQGQRITPSQGVKVLGHDVLEDCPDFWEKLYNQLRVKDFCGIANISKPSVPLSTFLLFHTYSRIGATLSGIYLERGMHLPELFRHSIWRKLEEEHPYIDWRRFSLTSINGIRDRVYGAKILTNPKEDNTIKCAETVYNLRDSNYLRFADPEKREKRRKKIEFIKMFLLNRLKDDHDEVEVRLLQEALDYAEDHLRHLETPTVGVGFGRLSRRKSS